MRLLDRYLLRELCVPLAYCLSGFLVFWISFDLFGELDEFQTLRMRGVDVLHYYVARLPELLVLVLPIALLLALLYALTNHARHQELTAIRAAGVSLWRLCVPYVGMGLLFSGLVFWLSETWMPIGSDLAEQIKIRRAARANPVNQRDWKQKLHFRNERAGRSWSIEAYNTVTFEMKSPDLIWEQPDGSSRHLRAESAQWTNGAWTFFNGQEYRFRSPGQKEVPEDKTSLTERTNFNQLVLRELIETPALIRSEIRISGLSNIRAAKGAQLSIADIRDYFLLHPDPDPRQTALLRTQLHARLASPWTCLVVVLIAIPFGAPSGRRNIFVGVAASIFICFSYFVLQRFCLALGTGGYLPPWLAAWLPNLFFGTLGLVLTSRA